MTPLEFKAWFEGFEAGLGIGVEPSLAQWEAVVAQVCMMEVEPLPQAPQPGLPRSTIPDVTLPEVSVPPFTIGEPSPYKP